MAKRQWWWVDRRSCIVVRGNRAVAFGVVQFAIFTALHEAANKSLLTSKLYDRVYAGAVPAAPPTHRVAITKMNRKLSYLDLKVCGVARRERSFYQLRDLRVYT